MREILYFTQLRCHLSLCLPMAKCMEKLANFEVQPTSRKVPGEWDIPITACMPSKDHHGDTAGGDDWIQSGCGV
jgi:hypothetical protein